MGASGIHLNHEMVEHAARSFLEMEPREFKKLYIIIKYLFNVRKMGRCIEMKGRGYKAPRCSWIVVDRKVYSFYVFEDNSYPFMDLVFRRIEDVYTKHF